MSIFRRHLMMAHSGGNPLEEPIVFEDANVKSILVGLWGGETGGSADTSTRLNGIKIPGIEGELTYRQAASVINLSRAFYKNTTIESFNELQYFVNLPRLIINEFNGCTSLREITLPTSLTILNNATFSNCSSLMNIDLKNVGTMGDSCFASCTSLTNVVGDFSNITVGTNTFTSSGLLSVNWGTRADVPDKTFSSTKLQTFDFSRIKTIGDNAFNSTRNWTINEINMPLVEDIGASAFQSIAVGGHSLNKIVIGENIKTIGKNCFNMSRAITTIVIKATIPPTFGDKPFVNQLGTRYIYVPDESVSAYQSELSTYSNYIKPISELPN